MKRQWRTMCLAALAALALATPADARRGIRMPFVIPGLGGGETIVKVLDLPDREPFLRDDGTFVDLGYIFKRHGEGAWVGYIGSDSRYVTFKPGGLEMLLSEAGIDQLPPVPKRPESWGWMVWAAFIALGLFAKLKTYLAGRAGIVTPAATAFEAAPVTATAIPDWTRRADQAMAMTAMRTARVPRIATPSVQAVGGRGGFGRR
jgi:hypothetical protein